MKVTVLILDETDDFYGEQATLLCECVNEATANTFMLQIHENGLIAPYFAQQFEVLAVDGYGDTE